MARVIGGPEMQYPACGLEEKGWWWAAWESAIWRCCVCDGCEQTETDPW